MIETQIAAQFLGFSPNIYPKKMPQQTEAFSLEGHLGLEPRTRGLRVPCSNQLS
jgi:hypothetical protein